MWNEVLLKRNLVWATRKCMVSIATSYMILEIGGGGGGGGGGGVGLQIQS